MILAVDAGNTAVTLGCVEGREILNLARLAASPGRSADEYAVRTFDEFKTVFLFVLGHPELYSEETHGDALEAGDIILAGSFTRPLWVYRGDTVHADYGPLGAVTCSMQPGSWRYAFYLQVSLHEITVKHLFRPPSPSS